jgi:tetratricopeptide (TPR) repeat protein
MKRVVVLAAAGLLLGIVTFASARAFRSSAQPPVAAVPPALPFANEQAWITSEIAAAIWNISAFAAGSPRVPQLPKVTERQQPGALAAFTVEIDGRPHDIAIADYVWSPSPFVPLARALMPSGEADHAPDHVDMELLTALTNPRASVIQAQNVRLSTLLRDHPRSPALHERGAMVLGALALREDATMIADPRLMMCRMSAHLAVARALEPETTRVERQLADAVLLTLVNRQRDGLAAVDALPREAAPDAISAWQRALKVRITKDWRFVADVEHASLLEQRETLRAVQDVVGDSRSTPMLERLPEDEEIPDWGRIIFHHNPTVGAGNRFAESAIPAEISEAWRVRATFPDAPWRRDSASLVRELNVEPAAGPAMPGDRPSLWIIDWGTWAASVQRHLIAAIVCRNRHYRVMLGLPREGDDHDRASRRDFGALRLFPMAEPFLTRNAKAREAYVAAVAGAATLAREHPELVTDSVFTELQERPFPSFAPDVPPSIRWFNPYFPVGTAFDPHRAYRIESRFRIELADLERLRTIAPYERIFVSGSLERRFGLDLPLEAVQRECADLAKYDLSAAWKIARAAYHDPDTYVPILRNIAETLNPDDYRYLAEYLAELHRDQEAEEAFERYLQVATDPVDMSGRAWWMILRYYETGRVAQAQALAREAANVYSGAGLIAYANVLELSGDLDRAEEFYRRNMERYDDKSLVLAFLMRHPERDTRHQTAALTSAVFPAGMQPLAQPPAGAPEKGLEITWAGIGGEREGLRKGDIIVALDGIRVENRWQYSVVRYRAWTAPMRFLVWRDKAYVTVDTRLRHRWVTNTIRSYPQDTFAR